MEKLLFIPATSTTRITAKFNKNFFEQQFWAKNELICGVDEVGRGCLAGPVVTAAVILPLGKTSRLLNDSKLMTQEEREKAFKWIEEHCRTSIGIINHRLIDTHNIYQASLMAMKKAVINLFAQTPILPGAILVDAMPLRLTHTAYEDMPVYHFYYGEKLSSSIAAASIVAKVTRDALMRRLETNMPGYRFAQHKGYATPLHKQALADMTIHSLIHRETFLTLENIDILSELENQLSIFI